MKVIQNNTDQQTDIKVLNMQFNDNIDFDNDNDIEHCFNISIEQLIKEYIIEKNAKNRAYFFILKGGYLEQFKEYCYKEKPKAV